MWSSQTGGVGHFAKFAEARLSQADPAKMARELAGEAERGRKGKWVSERVGDEVLVPREGDEKKLYQKALEVIKENARRVYDAPNKGVLWGWQVSAYVWTKAIAAGAFLVPCLAYMTQSAEVTSMVQGFSLGLSLIFLMATGILLVIDLDQPKRFLYVLLRHNGNRGWCAAAMRLRFTAACLRFGVWPNGLSGAMWKL
jgi:hypothetical protein